MSEQWDAMDRTIPHPNDVVGYWEGVTHMAYDEVDKTKSLSRHDFFAGMALNGMISHGMSGVLAVELAWDVADLMVKHGKR